MKVEFFDKKGKKSESKKEISDVIFADTVNKKLLSQAVFVYLSNQREANAHSKDRSEVSGGGKKPWKQKGTGRARHGSSRSPIWKGGGVTFGPTNQRNFKKTLTKKMRASAMRSAMLSKFNDNKLFLIENPSISKTKDVEELVSKLSLKGKITFVQKAEGGLYRCSKNLKGVKAMLAGEVSSYSILNSGNLIIVEDAVDEFVQRWGSESVKKKEEMVETKKAVKKTITKKTIKK